MAKELKVKKAPRIIPDDAGSIERFANSVYDDLNEIIRAINSQLNPDATAGKTGDIKVSVKDNNEYELRAKTKDGWAKVDLSFVDKEN